MNDEFSPVEREPIPQLTLGTVCARLKKLACIVLPLLSLIATLSLAISLFLAEHPLLATISLLMLPAILCCAYERRLREIAASASRSQAMLADLNTAQSISHIGNWVYDLSREDIALSDETCRIFSLPEGAHASPQDYLALVHPDDMARIRRDWHRALKGKPLFHEHRIRSGGRIRWIRQYARIEFDAAGQPLRGLGTTQDITELKQAEEELRIAATAFESQEGMLITDAAENILRVNPAFTQVTGYRCEEVVGKTPRILKSGRHDQAFYEAMWKQIGQNGAWQGEIWNRRKNGEIYPEWLTITAVRDGRGQTSHYVATLTDITGRKAAEDEIMHLAFYDPLTRLPNRRLLLDRLQQAMASSTRNARQGAILFIDLDNLKALNDSRGHDKGDLLLQQAAQRLSSVIREGDTASRFGGDEFVVMLVDLSTIIEESITQAMVVGQKILGVLERPYDLAGHVHQCTASIGITLFSDHLEDSFELLKQADLAMYEAKSAGRNTFCFYTPEMRFRLGQSTTGT